jgi:hypothetical protein
MYLQTQGILSYAAVYKERASWVRNKTYDRKLVLASRGERMKWNNSLRHHGDKLSIGRFYNKTFCKQFHFVLWSIATGLLKELQIFSRKPNFYFISFLIVYMYIELIIRYFAFSNNAIRST